MDMMASPLMPASAEMLAAERTSAEGISKIATANSTTRYYSKIPAVPASANEDQGRESACSKTIKGKYSNSNNNNNNGYKGS